MKTIMSILRFIGKVITGLVETIIVIVFMLAGPIGWIALYSLYHETRDERDARMTKAFVKALQEDRHQQTDIDNMIKRMRAT